jgi:restriction endonuclease S subunit
VASVSTTSSPNSGTIDGWTERSLGDIALVTMGQSPPSSAYNTDGVGLPLIQGNADIKNRKTIVRSWSSKWSKECRQGDIVMTVRAPVGSVAVAQSDVCLGRGVCALSPTINAEFLYHALVHREAEWSRLAQGSTFTAANGDQVRGFSLPIPNSIEEQRRIAEVLTDTDYLIDGLERLITKKRNVMKGTAQVLLSGTCRLPGFDREWTTDELGRHASMSSGGTPPTSIKQFYGGPHRWVSISDMTRSGRLMLETERTLTAEGLTRCMAQVFPVGTILFAMYASVGQCSIAGEPVATSQAILGIEPDASLDNVFLYYQLGGMKESIRRLGQQGTQNNLNKKMVQEFTIFLPEIDEQRAIAAVLTDMDVEIDALEKRLAKTRDLKTGMAQELLSGRTRLV